jgi:tetratricopeptide (TPR) repeat protein
VSQSLNVAGEAKSGEFDRANATFGDLMRRGRSYSGRERNCLFLNTAAGSAEGGTTEPVARFANISASSGIDLPDDGRALVTVDWDHDGDLDVWISNRTAPRLRFFRNDVPSDNHHLTLRLQGTGETTNRDAIGARVEIVLADGPSPVPTPTRPPLIKTLRAGDSFLSQSSKWVHFGLGSAETIESVSVRWPGGETETFTGLEVDHRYRLVQGSGEAEQVGTEQREVAISAVPVSLPAADSSARIPLTALLPMVNLSYQTFAGESQALPVGQGKAVLLNLWASWCVPCVAELKEMAERQRELSDAGIEIIALAVDGLEDDSPTAPAARKLAKRLNLPFTNGRATRELISYLQSVHDYQITSSQPLPVPVSFLIDADGRIAVIYKGPLNIDDLAADRKHSQGTLIERFARSAPIAGRTLPVATVSRRRNQFEARYRFATYLQQGGFSETAEAENRALIELFPENAAPHNNLGISYIRQQKFALAEASFREALRVQSDYGRAHANLGTLLAQLGKMAEAVGHFEQAIENDPRDKKSHAILGQLLLDLKRWPAAQIYLEKALVLSPQSANIHAHMGIALAQQGQLPQAVFYLEQALKIQPRHVDAQRNLTAIRRLIAEGN